MNVLLGELAGETFRHAAGELPLDRPPHRGPVKLGFRPEHAELVEPGTPGALEGEIYVVEPLGNETLVTVTVAGELLNVRAPAAFAGRVGEARGVRPLPERVHLFDVDTGEAPAAAGAGSQGEGRAVAPAAAGA